MGIILYIIVIAIVVYMAKECSYITTALIYFVGSMISDTIVGTASLMNAVFRIVIGFILAKIMEKLYDKGMNEVVIFIIAFIINLALLALIGMILKIIR